MALWQLVVVAVLWVGIGVWGAGRIRASNHAEFYPILGIGAHRDDWWMTALSLVFGPISMVATIVVYRYQGWMNPFRSCRRMRSAAQERN